MYRAPFLSLMEHQNQNLKLTSSILSADKSSNLDTNSKFLMYRSGKENIAPGEIPQCLEKFKKYKLSDLNLDKFETDHREQMETSRITLKIDKNTKRPEKKFKIRQELSKYRNELRQFSNNTKDLEDRYTKINSELTEMKQKHNYIITKRNLSCGDFDAYSDSSSTESEYSLKRKDTQIFDRSNSFIKILSNDPLKEITYKVPDVNEQAICVTNKHKSDIVERRGQQRLEKTKYMTPSYASSSYDSSSKNDYYEIDDHSNTQRSITDLSSLKKTITRLQTDSDRFCTIIEQQKNTLSDYRLRFVKARHLVKEQRNEIEQLNTKNLQLEEDASHIIDELHHKIEAKLRDVDHLSDKMRGEQVKREHTLKENYILSERIQAIEAEAKQLRVKLEEMSRRKTATISRLKAAERDLKIFKNYNAALKEEKRKLNMEMKSMSEQIDNMQNVNKRSMNRQREQTEKQKRQLQKRIFELEVKLNRSLNSTTSLIQERDTLIAELQNQLNNLVHNFEVSQKHIRVLRRHIYSMCGNSNQSVINNRTIG